MALKTTCVRALALLMVPFALAGCEANMQKEKIAVSEGLFTKAVNNTGHVYTESRDELMDNGLEAVKFLKQKVSSGSSEQEQWLAEIILARAENPVQFREVEKSFHEKLIACVYVDFWPKRRTMVPGTRRRYLPLPDDPLPFGSMRALEESMSLDYATAIRNHHEFVRISKSPLWGRLAGEIFLKGWTVPSDVLWQPHPTATGMLALVPGGAALEQDDYIMCAMSLLGRLGERRAGPKMLDIMKDENQNNTYRMFATRALGWLHYEPALPVLLDLAEADETHRLLRFCVFDALARMRDERAIPTLERISFWPDKYEPDVQTTIDWAPRARSIIQVIRAEDKK
jgi:hypothetical protein